MIEGLGGLLGGVGRFAGEALGGPFQKMVDRQVMSGLLADQQGQPFDMGQFGRGLLAEGYLPQGQRVMEQQARQQFLQQQQARQQDFAAQQNALYRPTAAQQLAGQDQSRQIQLANMAQQMQPKMPSASDFASAEKFVNQHGALAEGIGVIDRANSILEIYGTEAKMGLIKKNTRAASQLAVLDNQILASLAKAQEAGALQEAEYERYRDVLGGDPNAWFSVQGATAKMAAYEELKSLYMVRANRQAMMATRFANNPYYAQHVGLIQQTHKDEWLKAGVHFDPSKYAKVVRLKNAD